MKLDNVLENLSRLASAPGGVRLTAHVSRPAQRPGATKSTILHFLSRVFRSNRSYAEAVFGAFARAGVVPAGVEKLDQAEQFRQVNVPIRGIVVAIVMPTTRPILRTGVIAVFARHRHSRSFFGSL